MVSERSIIKKGLRLNIFYTNEDYNKCADEHCSIHTIKMITESAQMLCTAHRVLDGDGYANDNNMYKKTHVNHPCAVWVRESAYHYEWLYNMFVKLCKNYENYSGKKHKTSRLIGSLYEIPENIKFTEFTEPPLAMPDEIKSDNVVDSYRKYVIMKYKEWTSRTDKKQMNVKWFVSTPSWVTI